MIYNQNYHTWQFCNSTAWVGIGGQAAPQFAQNGYFVMSKSTWTANLGDVSGADALCLTELTTNTGWMGYSTANANGQLVSGNVHAFICSDDEGCNAPLAGATYLFANAGDSSAGGASFSVAQDGYSDAPNDWNAWNGSTYFDGTYTYWAGGRGDNYSGDGWENGEWTSGSSCSSWSDSLSTDWGGAGLSTFTDDGRWCGYDESYGDNCNASHNLICYVDPLPESAATAGGGCSSPAGHEGGIIYNKSSHTYQSCNGTTWIAWAAGGPTGGSGCSNPAGAEGNLIYNKSSHTYQFCNGTAWLTVTGSVFGGPAGVGYFVLSKSTFTGNLGDLSGADALCLTELTTNTGWMGYATAKANGQLVSGNVHAFLCDDRTCNNLSASSTYYFANANDANFGGASFITDSSGLGPNEIYSWPGPSFFGGVYSYWTGGRNSNNGMVQWGSGVWSTGSCSNWSDSSSSDYATSGYTNWFDPNNDSSSPEYGGIYAEDWISCNNNYHLICYVNP